MIWEVVLGGGRWVNVIKKHWTETHSQNRQGSGNPTEEGKDGMQEIGVEDTMRTWHIESTKHGSWELQETEAALMEAAWVCFSHLAWGFHGTPYTESWDMSDSSPYFWNPFHGTRLPPPALIGRFIPNLHASCDAEFS